MILIICGFLAMITTTYADVSQEANQADTVKLKKLLKEIASEDVYDMTAQNQSTQQQLYYRLLNAGSKFDFLKLAMEQKDPMIRIYAFKAIAETMDDLPAELVVKFKHDETPVKVLAGHIEKELPVSEIINGFLK